MCTCRETHSAFAFFLLRLLAIAHVHPATRQNPVSLSLYFSCRPLLDLPRERSGLDAGGKERKGGGACARFSRRSAPLLGFISILHVSSDFAEGSDAAMNRRLFPSFVYVALVLGQRAQMAACQPQGIVNTSELCQGLPIAVINGTEGDDCVVGTSGVRIL